MANTTTDIEQTFSDILNNIQQSVTEKNVSLYVNCGKQKMKILNEFALLFSTAFLQTIDDYNLSRNEIRAVLKIIDYIQFGNLFKMSYSKIANDLNIEKSNFSRIMKKLKLSKLIIDIDGNLYLNPHIIAKGNFKERSEEDMKILDKAAEE